MNRESERKRIETSFEVFGLTTEQREWVLEAMDSPEWDWYEDCDGCTAVSEAHWPTKYFPPCLRHDYDWMRGDGGWEASVRFYELQRAYGMSVWRAGLRAGAVTVFWYGGARLFRPKG